jgi:hypothetical protein
MPDDIGFFFIGGGVTELTHVADATGSNSDQVNVPGSAQAGDLAVMFDYAFDGVGGGTPSGWTNAQAVSGSGGSARINYKVLESGDVGATVTGFTSGTLRRQHVSVFRPDDEIDSVSHGSGGVYSGTGDPPNQTVAASSQQTPVLVVAGMGGFTMDMTSSPAFDDTIDDPTDATPNSRFGYKIYNSPPANHAIIATGADAGEKAVISCYIRVE